MARNGVLLLCFVLFIFVAHCFGAESEVETTDPTTNIDSKSSTSSNDSSIVEQTKPNSDSVVANHELKSEGRDGGIQEIKTDPSNSNSSKELGVKKNPDVLANTDDSSKELEAKKGKEKKQGNGEGSESKKLPKKGPTDEDLVRLKPSRKEVARGEECDSSNKCTDEKNRLIACLRVPGNDSPDYSLLIQNKGTNTLSINISAPDYVRLEKKTIQLLQKEDKKVKVTIGDGGSSNTSIILSAGNGQCILDFHDLLLHNSGSGKKTSNSMKFSYTDLSSRAPSILYISLAAVFLLGSIMLFVILRRRKLLHGDNSKYQKLETELPVSGVVKISEVTDGWDDSWGDDSWDDEEAPRTPSMPVTPSLSSKGLAARRSSKEGWKD